MTRASQTLRDNKRMPEEMQISDADFDRFRDFFYRKTGILFESSKRYFVDKRLIDRIEASGHNTFRSYFTYMRFQASGEELQHLINLLTVNETYFFREEYQFRCLVNQVLNDIVAASPRKKELRIWSIPSSTGEEPYSIAIYLLEHWPKINDLDVEIVASDIDSNVLDRCRKGVYSPRSLHNLSSDIVEKYFTQLSDNEYQIDADLRECVKFTHVNLHDPAQTRAYRGFDIIFCRNLLIYFDDASRRLAGDVFYDALNSGGYMFLGHSESMSRISSLFKVRKFSDALAYQKCGN